MVNQRRARIMKADHRLKSLSGVVMVLLLLGCNGESPTAPTAQPPVASTSDVAAWVRSKSGACLEGAVVEVLDGIRAGMKATQPNCGALNDGPGVSFVLPTGISVRLRASKDGYQAREITVVPGTTPGGTQIVLSPVGSTSDVAAWVLSVSGACLEGAVVEVLDGTRAGMKATQSNCEAIYDGGGVLIGLPTDVSVRLRASKDGYQSQEITVVPGTTPEGSFFVLTPQ
ncbi:MAG: hypothetical protein ABI718_02830 [Acidobacteriota bacterium]